MTYRRNLTTELMLLCSQAGAIVASNLGMFSGQVYPENKSCALLSSGGCGSCNFRTTR
jgi:hypothetical protein